MTGIASRATRKEVKDAPQITPGLKVQSKPLVRDVFEVP